MTAASTIMNVPIAMSLKPSEILKSGGACVFGSLGASFNHAPDCACAGSSLEAMLCRIADQAVDVDKSRRSPGIYSVAIGQRLKRVSTNFYTIDYNGYNGGVQKGQV